MTPGIRMSRRSATALFAVAATGTLVASATSSAAAGGPAKRKPTVVLVHGAFADSSSWNGVVECLQRDGYPVVTAAKVPEASHPATIGTAISSGG
jgi:alpha-beta hydrolase superfamily lysophospholipase